MNVFYCRVIGEIVSVAGCFETTSGCFNSDELEIKVLCQGYMLTGRVSRNDFRKAALEVGDFVPVFGEDLHFQCDEEFRKEDNITEEIPDEFELCNPTIHNWIRFCNNRATMKRLPPDYPHRG